MFVYVIELVFSLALFINALLFIPQIIKIIKNKSAPDVSLLTFAGFFLIQLAIVFHGLIQHDYLLVWGYAFSMVTCGLVVILILLYGKRTFKNEVEQDNNLEERLEILDNVIALMPGHVYWINTEGVYLGCNAIQAKSAGLLSRKDIIGKRNRDLPWNKKSSVLPEELDEINKQVMISGETMVVEEPGFLPDGKIATYLSSKVPLYNHKNKLIGLVGISIDITELKETQQELVIAKQKSEEANELKTKFIQNMQHDIRTPLSGAYSYLKDLAEQQTDPDEKKFISRMAASMGQLINTCNEIVDFNNIDYLGDTVKLAVVNVKKFVGRIIDLYSAAAHTRQVDLIAKIDPAVPELLKLDKLKLSRALLNITGNALKFTDEGSVTLRVKLLSSVDNIVTVAFEVHDTGLGIPNDKIDKIFDKFVRLNPSNQAKYKGSGLGLYYVKKFVDDMDGKLEVESEEGKGSTFKVTLTLSIPCSDEKEEKVLHEIDTFDEDVILHETEKFPDERFNKHVSEEAKEQTDSCTNSAAVNHLNSRPQLLLIEDDPILQRTIGKTFTTKGCEIIATVDSVSKACEAIKKQKYDLVVCDLGIYEGTGIDVMNWVRSDKNHPNQDTPFVVLTANNDDAMKKKALSAGFLQVFQKPLESAEAQSIVDKYIHTQTVDISQTLRNTIIDIDASMRTVCDVALLKEIFGMLSESILQDKVLLQTLYDKNDIVETRNVLLRLDGTLRSCVAPQLQAARGRLDEAAKEAQWLTTITPFYKSFYNEIDRFLAEYERLKKDGEL
jgi:signal transduction histidine kinase/CheY-like chemotaxis protein